MEEARVYYEQALALREASQGTHHPDLVAPLSNLGSLANDMGDPEAAIASCERALAIEEAALGVASRARAGELRCLAAAHRLRGELPRARALLEEAVALGDDTGAGGGFLYYSLAELGDVLVDQGEGALALERCNQAVAQFTAPELRDHPDLAYGLTCRGRALVAIGDAATARGVLTRALALREGSGAPRGDLADTRFALATALWPVRAERARARDLAARAREDYDAARMTTRAEDVAAWLAGRAR
jgi:tetratricopeptide (TPR) repeat protein